jgi:uncharacterized protein
MAARSELRSVTSHDLLLELGRVLMRTKFDARLLANGLNRSAIRAEFASLSETVVPEPVQGVAPDPDDDVVLGTALSGACEMIVTGDEGLLSVGKYRGVAIMRPRTALEFLSV